MIGHISGRRETTIALFSFWHEGKCKCRVERASDRARLDKLGTRAYHGRACLYAPRMECSLAGDNSTIMQKGDPAPMARPRACRLMLAAGCRRSAEFRRAGAACRFQHAEWNCQVLCRDWYLCGKRPPFFLNFRWYSSLFFLSTHNPQNPT